MNKKKLPKAIRNTAEEIRAAQAEPVVPAPAPVVAMKSPPFLQASSAISIFFALVLAVVQGMAPSSASVNHTAVESITIPSSLTGVIIHPDTRPGAERASPDWERRLLRAQSIIERHATYSALGGIIPLPIVNVGAVTTVILRMVKALTGEGRISGIVLMALPICLFFTVYYLNPDYVMLLFNREIGRQMISVAIFLQVLGAYTIKKIVDIKV